MVAAAGEPLAIEGNGTKRGMLRPVQAARTVSTRALSGIPLYSPQELVISARAGTPLPEIESALAERGQHLIAEPPDLTWLWQGGTQTIGGVVAANLSGPRRISWGATRDHLLGVRAVNGTGEVIRSGGRVLKNVTGLDLCKLLSGSHGTLAVLTEITLKVLPAPERAGTLVLPGLDAEAGVRALSAALGSPYGVNGAAWLPQEIAGEVPELASLGASVALIRVEDFAASVAYRTARLRAELGELDGQVFGDTATHAVWRAVRDATPLQPEPGEAVWRVSVRPSAGPGVLNTLTHRVGARGFLDWGGGLVWIVAGGSAETHAAVEQAAREAGGTWMLLRGPEPLRAAVDVIPREVAALARITGRVKAALDPKGILNPGRMYAGI
ncbi:MAG: FAD-binding protein [Alphaproteobacteria bacterium]|nr:FAD-binding protein [Alphaproteobacteria bacterium]